LAAAVLNLPDDAGRARHHPHPFPQRRLNGSSWPPTEPPTPPGSRLMRKSLARSVRNL